MQRESKLVASIEVKCVICGQRQKVKIFFNARSIETREQPRCQTCGAVTIPVLPSKK